jgi:hypothetical protein
MKMQLNEIKRMQKLAGILNENFDYENDEYRKNPSYYDKLKKDMDAEKAQMEKDKAAGKPVKSTSNMQTSYGDHHFMNMMEDDSQEVSPEKAASKVTKLANSLEKSPAINNIANKIIKDPKALKQLQAVLAQSGINPTELSENVDSSIVQKLALSMAKKAEDNPVNEEEGFDYGGAFWSGLVGGGTLAYYLASAGDVLTKHQELMGYSPSHMIETVGGAIAGAILAVVAKKVYDNVKRK